METIFFLKFYAYLMSLIGFALFLSKECRLGFIDAQKNNTILFGVITLILGVITVISHNIWQGSWQICITVLGYLTLIKGFIRILNLPGLQDKITKHTERSLKIVSVFIFLFALILFYGAISL